MTINLIVDFLYTRARSAGPAGSGGLTVSTVGAAAPEIAPVAVTAAAQQAIETPFRRVAREFASSKVALLGLAVLVTIVLLALLAPLIALQNLTTSCSSTSWMGACRPAPSRCRG